MADRGRVGVDRLQNPYLHKLVVQQNQGHHQRKLNEIRFRKKGGHHDTLDNSNPESRELSHVWYNAKRNEFMNLREQDINNVNHFLLEGIARNKVTLAQHVAVPPKALTALTRIRRLEEITRDNEVIKILLLLVLAF
jgi:hypothetical protein